MFRLGQRESGKWIRLHFAGGEGGLGVTTARAIGCHARRNRVKRRLREALRACGLRSDGMDVVATAKANCVEAPFGDLLSDVNATLARAQSRWESA